MGAWARQWPPERRGDALMKHAGSLVRVSVLARVRVAVRALSLTLPSTLGGMLTGALFMTALTALTALREPGLGLRQ